MARVSLTSNAIVSLPYGQTVVVEVYAGGGGGGGSVYTGGAASPAGGNGGESRILINGNAIAIAGGGRGGFGGWWGNGSHYSGGTGGLGGTNTTNLSQVPIGVKADILSNINGVNGWVNNWSPQPRVPGPTINGVAGENFGGNGAWGVGDESLAGGGSGGSGGYVQISISNSSDKAINVEIQIGEGGAATTYGNASTKGGNGYGSYDLTERVLITKYKELVASIRGENISTSQNFSYLGEAESVGTTLSQDKIDGYHVNLWDYFYKINGRRPAQNEAITFIIPPDMVLVAPFGYTAGKQRADIPTGNQFYQNYSYRDETNVEGYPAVSLKGWNKALNNKITIDVKGVVLGSFVPSAVGTTMTPCDKVTGKVITYSMLKNMGGFSDAAAAYAYCQKIAKRTSIFGSGVTSTVAMTNPVKNPAIYSEIDCKVIIRSGGFVLGGGGSQQTSPMNKKSDVIGMVDATSGNSQDTLNLQGGHGIIAGGNNVTVSVENYGYLSGGGGGGNSAGQIAAGLMDNNAVYAAGGHGAPLGGVAMSGCMFPLYLDLNYIKTLPVTILAVGFDLDPIYIFDDNFNRVLTNNEIVINETRVVGSVDWSRIGFNQYGDNILDITPLKVTGDIRNNTRLLSPTAGSQIASANNYNVIVSGSGGAPGVSGQKYTLIAAGSPWLRDVPNVQGIKGDACRTLNQTCTILTQNFPGGTFNQ